MIKLAGNFIAFIVVATCASSAFSQAYVEAEYSGIQIKSALPTARLGLLGVAVGYELHPNLAVEGLLTKGVSGDIITIAPIGGVDVKLDYLYAIFVKPKLQISERVAFFGKLGWMKNRLIANQRSESDNDFAYAAGAQFDFTKTVYGTASYMRLYDKKGVKVDGWNFGVGYRF